MSGIQYPVDIKGISRFEHQNNISVNVYGYKDKKIFLYVLPPRPLQGITWIYYISLLLKNFITYWWITWADWYQANIIITKVKHISVNIVCTAAPVKRYWKTIWKDASNTGRKKVTTRRDVTKSNLQKQNTNLFSSTQILKAFYVNKTPLSHRHQNLSPPNTSITYHVGAASTSNAVMWNILNHPKWICGMTPLKSFWTRP